jgi:hypothetical protein
VEEIKRALAGQRELSKKVDAITEMLGKLGGSAPAPAPTAPPTTDGLAQKALDELGQFKRSMAFRDALDSATLDPADKKLIKRLFDAEKPEDPATWLTAAMADLPARGTPTSGNQASAPGQSAPGRAAEGALPANPVDLSRLRPDVWRAMSPEDKRAAWQQAMPVSDVQRFFKVPPKKG